MYLEDMISSLKFGARLQRVKIAWRSIVGNEEGRTKNGRAPRYTHVRPGLELGRDRNPIDERRHIHHTCVKAVVSLEHRLHAHRLEKVRRLVLTYLSSRWPSDSLSEVLAASAWAR